MRKLCHRLNGAVVIGLALLAVVSMPSPKISGNVKVPDFLEEALWAGCRTQGIQRLKAHMLGSGWRF